MQCLREKRAGTQVTNGFTLSQGHLLSGGAFGIQTPHGRPHGEQ